MLFSPPSVELSAPQQCSSRTRQWSRWSECPDGAIVERSEDAGAHSEPFQAPETVQSLLGLFHNLCGMCGPLQVPGDVDPKELKTMILGQKFTLVLPWL